MVFSIKNNIKNIIAIARLLRGYSMAAERLQHGCREATERLQRGY
jgi:hypothetical protein